MWGVIWYILVYKDCLSTFLEYKVWGVDIITTTSSCGGQVADYSTHISSNSDPMPTFVEIPVVHGLNFNNLSNYQYPVDHYNYTATENSNSI